MMISTSEAISIVNESTKRLSPKEMALGESLNHILAEDAVAKLDLPPFNQSAMDGYALKLHDSNVYHAICEIKAGDDASSVFLKPGEAIKIFTGAMCPLDADLVCRIEDISINGYTIKVNVTPNKGANIRLKGEQINEGEKGLSKGTTINPAAIGFLANLGIKNVQVFPSPKISIISTGNELVTPQNHYELPIGKIYESNGLMLKSAIESFNFSTDYPIHLLDDYTSVLNGLKTGLDSSDVLIISGGISVGDYDFVGEALLELDVEQKFYKVNQKPGKPLFFGTKDNKLVFALPGNPAAALTCFYIYVLPALNKMAGKEFTELNKSKAAIETPIEKSNSREQFLKAVLKDKKVTVLEGQSSAMLRTFAEANALIHLPANSSPQKGELVDVIELP